MKKSIHLLLLILILVGTTRAAYSQNLPIIDKAEKSFNLYMDYENETPLIFGFRSPDVNSEKMICFSSATSDIEDNPHQCSLGAFYETGELIVQFIGFEGAFVKLKIETEEKGLQIFYIENKNVRLD